VTELALLVLLAEAAGGAAPPDISPVAVQSATTCPSADEVEARLRVLLPPAAVAPKRARVSAEDGALRIHLEASDGTLEGDRTVTVEAASCADRASVVAVVIAAWDAQHRGEDVQAPALPRPAGPPATVIGAPPSAAPPLSLEVTAGPALTLTSDGLAPAASASLAVWRSRLGARLGLTGFLPRTLDVGAGSARWSRAGASVELGLRLGGPLTRLDAHAGLVAGLLTARGSGFDVDHAETRLIPGLTAGLDGSRRIGNVVLGLGVTGAAFGEQTLVDTSAADGAPLGRALPRLQLTFALHAGWTF
jgi:hypothetical protein